MEWKTLAVSAKVRQFKQKNHWFETVLTCHDFQELSLATVLRCGQSFRWKQNGDVWYVQFKSSIHE